jgi:CHAD domain-containing protein
MAHAISIPSRAPTEHRGLSFWMKRTLQELAEFRTNSSADAVHDLRVALRRCRSVASAIEEIDPHPAWEQLRDEARKLFRSLGELRDAQVMADWLRELGPEEVPGKRSLLESLAASEEAAQKKALHHAGKFDQTRWQELARTLGVRIRRVPIDGEAARCLALERLEEAKELHRRAMRTESAKPWHALRIGVKRFRYTVESLLPAAHSEWSESLKRVQDILGNIHDLDMLAELVKHAPAEHVEEAGPDWSTLVGNARHQNLETYRQLTLGTTSIWRSWLSGFPHREWLRYAKARIAATRKAMDPRPARGLTVTRLAMRMWSQLRESRTREVFSELKEQRVLEAAALLSGIRDPAGRKSREKSARTFLLKSPVPPGWNFAEWERAAWAIRFQRGAPPGPENKRFSQLSAEQQTGTALLAGILRLSAAAQKCGVTSGTAARIEVLPQALLLRVSGVEDSPENAARFAEAKKLLERSLGKTILIQSEPAPAERLASGLKTAIPQPIAIVR